MLYDIGFQSSHTIMFLYFLYYVGTLDDSTGLSSSTVTLDSVRALLSKQEHRGLHVLDLDGTGSSLIVYR